MALIKTVIEVRPNGEVWYDIHSDTEGKGVLQVETGVLYGAVAITDTDPYTYEEADDPDWNPEPEIQNEAGEP